MSTRSKFESKLGFREIGFSIKIPDVGKSLKPFDYVVGVPIKLANRNLLRFVAIEAKTARGWTLRLKEMRPHQIVALDLVESMAPYSSWLAVGFLDMPKMQLNWLKEPITKSLKAEAFLMPWIEAKVLFGNVSMSYGDIPRRYLMEYGKVGNAYKWTVPFGHDFFNMI